MSEKDVLNHPLVIEERAKWHRRREHLGRVALGHAEKCERLKAQIRELEDLLVWINRTEQPLTEIRRVIAERIPQRLRREAES